MGWFRSLDAQHISPQERTRDTVIAWKKDPRMLEQFDTDGDGRLDEAEFAVLREEARRHAETVYREQTLLPQTHVLGADPHGRPFLLSSHDQDGLARRLRLHAWLWLAVALVALGVLVHRLTDLVPAG